MDSVWVSAWVKDPNTLHSAHEEEPVYLGQVWYHMRLIKVRTNSAHAMDGVVAPDM